jgi:hypothetical protein
MSLKTNILWKTELKNGVFGKLTPPLADPFNPDHFYISDGWGSMFASIRSHKLSFTTGKEIANVLIRNSVRCMYFTTDGQYIFAITDNKIYQLSRETLEIVKKYEKGIPKYSDYVTSNDQDTLILMNHAGLTITAYNYIQGTVKKKKTKGEGCGLIERESVHTYLFASNIDGIIQRYDIAKNKIEPLFKTDSFHSVCRDSKGNWFFHLGKYTPPKTYANYGTGAKMDPLYIIRVLKTDGSQKDYQLDIPFDNPIQLSADEQSLFLSNAHNIWQFSLQEERITNTIVISEEEKFIHFFEKQQFLLCAEADSDYKKLVGRRILGL